MVCRSKIIKKVNFHGVINNRKGTFLRQLYLTVTCHFLFRPSRISCIFHIYLFFIFCIFGSYSFLSVVLLFYGSQFNGLVP